MRSFSVPLMSAAVRLVNSKPYRSSTHFVQPASMLLGGSNRAIRGSGSDPRRSATHSPAIASDVTRSVDRRLRQAADDVAIAGRPTVAFAFQAALSARNALVSCGLIDRCAPVPVDRAVRRDDGRGHGAGVEA